MYLLYTMSSFHSLKSPEIQPEVSMHLRVCTDCREILTLRQLKQAEVMEEEERTGEAVSANTVFSQDMVKINFSFLKVEDRVKEQLKKVIYIYNRVGDRSPILLNQIAICRGEIDTNLGIFCRCEILTNSTAN